MIHGKPENVSLKKFKGAFKFSELSPTSEI